MDEIISSILDAEKKADNIVKKANETAKSIRTNADINAEKIKNDSITLFKLHYKKSIIEAEKKAEEEYNKVILEGEASSNELINKASKYIETVADDVFKGIIK